MHIMQREPVELMTFVIFSLILLHFSDNIKLVVDGECKILRKEALVSSDKWKVKCRVQKGMFDDEYL